MLKFDDHGHSVVTHYYEVDDQALAALGVRLAAGRFFYSNEVLPPRRTSGEVVGAPVAVITQALANDLFPDGHALGKTIFDSFGFLAARPPSSASSTTCTARESVGTSLIAS